MVQAGKVRGVLDHRSVMPCWAGKQLLVVGIFFATLGLFPAAAIANAGGDLWTYGSGGATDTGQTMAAGTNPSITAVSTGGVEIAYQGSNGDLWTYGAAGSANTGGAMMAGTSPSIVDITGDDYEIAYQGSDGDLWEYGYGGTGNTGDAMMAGTSPSITSYTGGGEIAFQGSNGDLWEYGSTTNNGSTDTGSGMLAHTTPSITDVSAGEVQAAFQANNGLLWEYGSGGTGSTTETMLAGTSPSIAPQSSAYEIAYQGSTGDLWDDTSTGAGGNTGAAMMAGTSPSIAGLSSGGYEIAFQGAVSAPVVTTPTPVSVPTPPSPVSQPGHPAQRRLKVKIILSWTWAHSRSTLRSVRVGKLPRGASVTISCRGRGCPRRAAHADKAKLSRLLASLDGAVYRAGDRIYITVSAPGYLAERAELVIRNGARPTVKLR
jgi:hypothetical protein